MNRLTAPAAALALACALLTGCNQDTADARLASARQYLAQHDAKSAAIELKNALQLDPNQVEARYQLGKLLFDAGDYGAAAIELRKAFDLGYSPDVVVPPLAQALLRQGQGHALIEQFGAVRLGVPGAVADLQTSLAIAYALEPRRGEQSRAALDAAFAAVPDYVPALVAHARRQAIAGDAPAAFATLDRALAKAPADHEVRELQGDLLWGLKGDAPGALAAYRAAIGLRGDSVVAHAGALAVAFAVQDLAAAKLQLDGMRKALPGHPLTRMYAARLAFEQGDLKTAGDLAQQMLKAVPDDPQALLLAGAVAARQGTLPAARQWLGKAVQAAPDSVTARRLLTQVLLQAGQPQAALGTALPLLDHADAASYDLVGLAYLQNGDAAKAEELQARAHALDPSDVRSRTALAASRLFGGRDADAALGELTAIATSDQGIGADLALVAARLQRKDVDGALRAIDRLQAKQPGAALAPGLRGKLLLARGDVAGARLSFERALAADPLYFPAADALAGLDLQDGRFDAAVQRYEAILAARPNDVPSLLARARIAQRAGAGARQAAGWLDRAVRADPSSSAARVAQIDYYLGVHDTKAALASALAAAAALPDQADVVEAQARALIAAGDTNRALSAYAGLTALRPRSPQALVGLAGAQAASHDAEAALQTLKQALALAPDHAPALKMTIALDQSLGRHADALAVARGVQRSQPDSAAGYLYEGDIETLQKHWPAAAAAYRTALARPDGAGAAQRLHIVLTADGKRAEADRTASAWQAQHPKDTGLAFYLGSLALSESNHAAAREQFARIVDVEPSNADAQNNLAWTLGQLKLPGAIDHARTADRLRPHQPAILDTLAGLLAEQGRYADAIALQREAVALDPQVRSRRLALAKFYAKAGDRTQAREELQVVLQAGTATAEYREAEGMLKVL
ncbi:MAG: PEP-CTERM system TPR-repeat protein PrsT [Proteobacteria bacterium]|nr:PEP-CTERM system TPR-repeat protein PrsT [Pseudomonadota bacterium]